MDFELFDGSINISLASFLHSEKIKAGLCDRHAVYVSVYPPIEF